MAETSANLHTCLARYLATLAAARRPNSLRASRNSIQALIRFLEATHPDVTCFSLLRRHHIEGWLRQMASDVPRRLSVQTRRLNILRARMFLMTIAAWGWKEAPPGAVFHAGDAPPQELYLPKPISREHDEALKKQLAADGDLVACSLLIMRFTGIRIGELMDMELDCILQLPDGNCGLRVPIGKLHNERCIPVDARILALVDKIRTLRGEAPPLPHPETGKLSRFLLQWPPTYRKGRRPSANSIRRRLAKAATSAGIREHLTVHRLRHTFATEMLRGGMLLPVLMQLLGHRSMTMTLRYAQISPKDIRDQYNRAVDSFQDTCPVPGAPSRSRSGQPPDLSSGASHLLNIAAAQIESTRREIASVVSKKKLQRLAERVRKILVELLQTVP